MKLITKEHTLVSTPDKRPIARVFDVLAAEERVFCRVDKSGLVSMFIISQSEDDQIRELLSLMSTADSSASVISWDQGNHRTKIEIQQHETKATNTLSALLSSAVKRTSKRTKPVVVESGKVRLSISSVASLMSEVPDLREDWEMLKTESSGFVVAVQEPWSEAQSWRNVMPILAPRLLSRACIDKLSQELQVLKHKLL